mgnify:CR=1 FL=1
MAGNEGMPLIQLASWIGGAVGIDSRLLISSFGLVHPVACS